MNQELEFMLEPLLEPRAQSPEPDPKPKPHFLNLQLNHCHYPQLNYSPPVIAAASTVVEYITISPQQLIFITLSNCRGNNPIEYIYIYIVDFEISLLEYGTGKMMMMK